jgi:hypothetical protein
MAKYAKIKREYIGRFAGEPIYKFSVKAREIESGATITEDQVVNTDIDDEQHLRDYLLVQGYKVVPTWRTAEMLEGVYRDGTRNIYRYRNRNGNRSNKSETLDQPCSLVNFRFIDGSGNELSQVKIYNPRAVFQPSITKQPWWPKVKIVEISESLP